VLAFEKPESFCWAKVAGTRWGSRLLITRGQNPGPQNATLGMRDGSWSL